MPFVTGLVLAAGGSQRLGAPKQLLPYNGRTLLDHVLDTARACAFDQLVCVIGGAADEVRARVDLTGATVVENQHFGEGCSSSIAAALASVNPHADVLVLMLGDQPGVRPQSVSSASRGSRRRPVRRLRLRGRPWPPARVRPLHVRRPKRAARRQGRVEAARSPRRPGGRRAHERADPARRRHRCGLPRRARRERAESPGVAIPFMQLTRKRLRGKVAPGGRSPAGPASSKEQTRRERTQEV